MCSRIGALVVAMNVVASMATGGDPEVADAEKYHVEAIRMPEEDLSGPLGPRCLALLSEQVSRNLNVMEADRKKAGLEDPRAIATDGPYFEFFTAGSAYAAGVLVRCGELGETMGGLGRDELRDRAVEMIQAVAGDHRLGGGGKGWSIFRSARIVHLLGMAAWLLWEELDEPTRVLVARIIEHEADRFLDRPAPARLHGDTQAESNAWTGGGLAVAACMLKSHPHRDRWAEKANEYMISAYATARDVASDEVVDGKPLGEWLTAPNAFSDYTVENHGLVHPDYLGAISEMVRSAVAFRLAGEPVPRAATFNAEEVLDLLIFLYLPDGTLLYPQNTDYTPRRLDVFLQAAGIVSHKPNPIRKACLLRSLAHVEKVAAERPRIPLNGWPGFRWDLGSTWGLTQNYLTLRLFGQGGEALPDDRLESELAGVFASEEGKFVVHRTPGTISSFSWRATGKQPLVMGMTMPLEKDVLCYPMPSSYIGEVREPGRPARLTVHSHRLAVDDDGFAATVELGWCEDKVRQQSAFVSLPDGRSVYLELRRAVADVVIESATSGDVALFDDVRWYRQTRPRVFFGEQGPLQPGADTIHEGNWVNVDDRLGYAVVDAGRFRLAAVPGRPCIWRGDGTMYDTCRLAFAQVGSPASGKTAPVSFRAGELVGRFGVVTSPSQSSRETADLAGRLAQAGWRVAKDNVLVLLVDQYLVYANVSARPELVIDNGETITVPPETAGWAVR